jgi:uncharacterized protein YkwD
MVRRIAAALTAAQLMLLWGGTGASASTCQGDTARPTAATATQTAGALLCDVNAARTVRGLRPLRWNSRLLTAAQELADAMVSQHFFDHVTPDGQTLLDRVSATGYLPSAPTWLLAENLGWGTGVLATPISVVTGWINSPGHRRNMLDPALQDIGVAVEGGAVSSPATLVGTAYVADFGTRNTRRATRASRHRRR